MAEREEQEVLQKKALKITTSEDGPNKETLSEEKKPDNDAISSAVNESVAATSPDKDSKEDPSNLFSGKKSKKASFGRKKKSAGALGFQALHRMISGEPEPSNEEEESAQK